MEIPNQFGSVQETLQHWREEGRLAQEKCIGGGIASREELVGKSGIEFFAGMLAGEIPRPHMAINADITFIRFDYGHFIMQGSPSVKFQNTIGTIHGGWIATILDSVVGCAVHTTLPVGMAYATAELKVSYLRPLTAETELVRAEATVISSGKKIAFAEGTLFGPDGKRYAHATTTCAVFPGIA